jgi:hypothetical protein
MLCFFCFCKFLLVYCGLNEPGGCFGGYGPKMCKTRVWGVLGGMDCFLIIMNFGGFA